MTTTNQKQLVIFIGDYFEFNVVTDNGKSVVDVFNDFRDRNDYCKAFLNVDHDDLMEMLSDWVTPEDEDYIIDQLGKHGFVFDGEDVYVLGDQVYIIFYNNEDNATK